MKKVIYNKLVRDRIPEIIRKDNSTPATRILDEKDYGRELAYKLLEESIEAVKARYDKFELMKEIGDIYEVIDAMIEAYGLSKDNIVALKEDRKMKRGGFKDRIYLEYVEDVGS
jgi:predicted house-cleaning noncanonical NTP pyrophosphatase (MazG superfamily)